MKNECEISFKSIIDYFLKFIQLVRFFFIYKQIEIISSKLICNIYCLKNEPVSALSFLADHDPNEKFKTSKPTIYKNLLVS